MSTSATHERAALSYDSVAEAHKERDVQQPYRVFNNFIKKHLIQTVMDSATPDSAQTSTPTPVFLRVLDLASGRGGDVSKWLYAQSPPLASKRPAQAVVSLYRGFDISPISVEESNKRVEGLLSQHSDGKSFVSSVANCFVPPFFESAVEGGPFDIASVQFSLHYAAESLASLQYVLKGVAANLKPGGYFCGTIVDAQELSERLRGGAASRQLFCIKLPEGVTTPSVGTLALGTPYHFHVRDLVDCPEYCLPFDTLCNEAAAVGLSVVSAGTFKFSDMIQKFKEDPKCTKDLMFTRGAFDQDQRELVSLYRTFCFRKCK